MSKRKQREIEKEKALRREIDEIHKKIEDLENTINIIWGLPVFTQYRSRK